MHQKLSIFKTSALAAGLLSTLPVQSAELDAPAIAGLLPESGEYHLTMFNGDSADGFMRLGWYREGDDLIVYDRTMMPSAEVFETYKAKMSAATLQPESVNIQFHQGTVFMDIEASLDAEKVSGSRSVKRMGVEAEKSDFSVDSNNKTILRAVSFILPLALDTEPGQEIGYTWFSPLGAQMHDVSLVSSDGGVVETPLGSFETTKWELRGGNPENDIYVSRGDDQRIVRIDVLGQPLQFLATQ